MSDTPKMYEKDIYALILKAIHDGTEDCGSLFGDGIETSDECDCGRYRQVDTLLRALDKADLRIESTWR